MVQSLYTTSFLVLLLAFLSMIISPASAGTSSDDKQIGQWNSRPRQFRMQIYSRAYLRGDVQHVSITNGASTPCWDLDIAHVGSYTLNDPLVKVIFYRSPGCKGAPSATYQDSFETTNNRVLIKAKSVSIVKVRLVSSEETFQ